MSEEPLKGSPPTFWHVIQSVLAAMFGVQSNKARARDSTSGKPLHYIVVGLVFTLLFVLVLWGVVRLVLSVAGV